MVIGQEHVKKKYGDSVMVSEDNLSRIRRILFWKGGFGLQDVRAVITLFCIGIAVRCYIIYEPALVVFDEVHFGKFASMYLNSKFYMDVHPPAAKMLIYVIGLLGGLDPTFRFDSIGVSYLENNVPYVFMRLVSSILGVLIVLCSYVMLRGSGLSVIASFWTSVLMVFDNCFTTQFRLIFLDSYLAFGTACAACFYVLFNSRDVVYFSNRWWILLLLSGISIGFSLSCKWVGLFTMASIGVFVIYDLWETFGDQSVRLYEFSRNLFGKFLCLLIVPFSIYMLSFYFHMLVLKNYQNTDGISLEFSHDFHNTRMNCTYEHVGYGSTVTLRHYISSQGYLHSHSHLYPTGSKQQQVTLYGFSDNNSKWTIYPEFGKVIDADAGFVPIRNGDIVRLEHFATKKFLHSHKVKPPISEEEHNNEVSCYGTMESRICDTNDNWEVVFTDSRGNILRKNKEHRHLEVGYGKVCSKVSATDDPYYIDMEVNKKPKDDPEEDDMEEEAEDDVFAEKTELGSILSARRTYFTLVHVNTRYRLHSFMKKLPDWGFKQQEVLGGRDTLRRNSVWVIESNSHALFNNSFSKSNYGKIGFLNKFIQINKLMWNINNRLCSHHYFGSRPESWPLLTRGLAFWSGSQALKMNVSVSIENDKKVTTWKHGNYEYNKHARAKYKNGQIYLLGNPIVWWATSLCILLNSIYIVWKYFGKGKDISPKNNEFLSMFLYVSYFMHYIPFFLMGRQLFLHHYVPAYYFGINLLGLSVDKTISAIFRKMNMSEERERTFKIFFYSLSFSIVMSVFLKFSPLSYGTEMSKEECESLRWLRSWDFDCEGLRSEAVPGTTVV